MEPSADKTPVQSPATAPDDETAKPAVVTSPAHDSEVQPVTSPVADNPAGTAGSDGAAPSAEPFPVMYNIFAVAPFITGLLGYTVSLNSSLDTGWMVGALFIIATCLMLFGFVKQILYIRRYLPERNIRPQLVLAVASFVVPALGAVAGDVSGLISFGDSASQDSGLWFCLAVAGGFASWIVGFLAIGNIITIRTRQSVTALRVIAIILQVLGWAALLALAFVLYLIAYSARDPSSE